MGMIKIVLTAAAALGTATACVAEPIVVQAGSVGSAYELLQAGKTQSAIDELNRVSGRNDPTRLINLGTAYARMGRVEDARLSYRAAMRTDDRAEVELSDGSWMDSRAAARLALRRLSATQVAAR
jgi:Flp pilus assembly protein TadD